MTSDPSPVDIQDAEEEEYVFNEYSVDDTLNPLERFLRYYQADFSLQRSALVRELVDTAVFAGYEETVRQILPQLPPLASDPEPTVRLTLAQQLKPLSSFLVKEGGEGGYEQVLKVSLPFAFELLVDRNVEVAKVSLQTIRELAELVRPEDVNANLLTVVIGLAHDERAEDYRVVAAELFNHLAKFFGPECCSTDVIRELTLLSSDSSFSVRKAVGSNLGAVCRVVDTPEAQKSLIELYLTLCRDDIWGVRKSCAEAVEEVSEGLPEEARLEFIVPAFCALLEDGSRWVRARAHESLGRLLHTLQSKDITEGLLRLYTDMAMNETETELSEHCAFNFPAVLQAVGAARWGELERAYATMLRDEQWKVRKSLAYSLHEVAHLLGRELAEQHLVAAFELLLKDLDEIKLGVVVSAHHFLKVLSEEKVELLVPTLCHVPLESENWRLRNEVAKCVGDVALLLSPAHTETFSAVIALVLRLLDDSVMEVRSSTYRPAALIVNYLYVHKNESGANLEVFLKKVLELAERPSFQSRQMFMYFAQQAAEIRADALMEEHILPVLLKLSADPVSNVRLVLKKVMDQSFVGEELIRVNHHTILIGEDAMTEGLQQHRYPTDHARPSAADKEKWRHNAVVAEIMTTLEKKAKEDEEAIAKLKD
ncbi:serine/threonine-protein phosphatase 4 regulatory subunit 1 [Angomonas deanei]|uniref:HEAT repeat n=1 Tax=Angomonas deanei TaxID=59799 RepID=S9WXP7_9TRYP|nr:serine/threonine-protein phosphatase 4 regulatory subunit 1 [Angomonas deanei]EPY40840.1 serine/threonine-protein phosphatase 4 regulatory subunit 1 [Angomonas deanei]EPY43788.1 serine/threonine-protein phosphatase 4 regulatory subunit 1 [Angomonas deanei]CAD2222283.1 hypothetical protein, conserved [Angomonas deanei]|eukprot:EPY31627.1 serine/threonine-protein phosphatase 4 regulatory subunit 1 [Angomonas deanei]